MSGSEGNNASSEARQVDFNHHMDKRISALEADNRRMTDTVGRIDSELKAVQLDMAVVKNTMAGKVFIVTAVLLSLTILGLLIGFRDHVQNWLVRGG